MPTYNYYCSNCDIHFSFFQKMSESSLSKCEECGGKIERVITGGTGLIFKGSGFYKTDYKEESKGPKKDIQDSKSKKSNSKTKDNKQLKSKKVEKKTN